MTKYKAPRKSHSTADKAQAKKFLMITFGIVAVLMFLMYFIFKDSF